MQTKFDSQQYAWSDVSVQIGARIVTGLRGIKYGEKQEMEYLYGASNRPIAIAEGNIAYDGEVKLLQNELELLIEQAPGGRLQALRDVQIVVTYNQGQVLVTDIIGAIRFTEVEKMFEQGAKFMEVTLPIMFLTLKLNV